MSGYTKLFSSIVSSTIWREAKETKVLWITMLALADKDGFVEASLPGLAHLADLNVEETVAALKVLESPDTYSRSPEDEGRRVRAIDGGWFLVNHDKYRLKTGIEDRKEYVRLKKAESRARAIAQTTDKSTVATSSTTRTGFIYYVGITGRVKIGLSKNPWARLKELKSTSPEAELLAFEIGDESKEADRSKQFGNLSIGGGWFWREPSLVDFLANIGGPAGSTTEVSTTSNNTEAEAEAYKAGSLREPAAQPDGLRDAGGSDLSPEDLAAYNERCDNEGRDKPATDLQLKSEDEDPGRQFPWRQVEGAMNRITPELRMRSKGERRDQRMKMFWRNRGRTVGAFELLATKVQASDFLMGRNGHKGQNDAGRAFPWSWIFDVGKDGKLRADKVMDDFYSNERMAFVPGKRAAAKLTKVMLQTSAEPVMVNLDELHEGEKRYSVCGDRNGIPDVIDLK